VGARRVVVYSAPGCHLCEQALQIVAAVCGDDFGRVDIAGDPALEAAYRERIPVVEVDGEAAFTYFVTADGLRERLARL
jgi:hypothetical protein